MLSVTSLRHAIDGQLSEAASKRKLAEDLMRSADEHAARGDEVKAKMDRDSAERYLRDIEGIERTIAGYEADIQHREQKAAEIERRINDLRSRHEHEMRSLEDQKEPVVARLMYRDDNIIAAKNAVKDKNLSNKQQDLQKHFERELDKLEREKQLLLG